MPVFGSRGAPMEEGRYFYVQNRGTVWIVKTDDYVILKKNE